jgi:hypothetical protein
MYYLFGFTQQLPLVCSKSQPDKRIEILSISREKETSLKPTVENPDQFVTRHFVLQFKTRPLQGIFIGIFKKRKKNFLEIF